MKNREDSSLLKSIVKFAEQLELGTCLEFNPDILIPEQRIRELCSEDKCENFGKHYMCPPFVGSLKEHKERLKKYTHGILLQYSKLLNVNKDREGAEKAKVDFHRKILQLEDFLRDKGIKDVWGMIGGSCYLCDECQVRFGRPCLYPDKARMSLESIAIDVLDLLDKFGLDNKFYPDRITWTGCILMVHLPIS
ncbi:MAG: DUF2284 domain-containing protein [Syntrophales bacterium]|nr:DUF2284 domain-containing protein [Syntrophales bacterium]